jgi:hypothetical protein
VSGRVESSMEQFQRVGHFLSMEYGYILVIFFVVYFCPSKKPLQEMGTSKKGTFEYISTLFIDLFKGRCKGQGL